MASNQPLTEEKISQEEFEKQLKGVVLNVDQSDVKRRWTIGGALALTAIGLASWSYFYLLRSDEQKLREKLADYQALTTMYQEAALAIRSPNVSTEILKDSIDQILNISTTTLRETGQFVSPYVPERYLSLVEALEGLCRLVVEKRIDLSIAADLEYYRLQLTRLGLHQVEYYEDGIVQQIPLLQSAALQKELYELQQSPVVVGTLIEDLKQKLEQIALKESFSVVAPALLLGKWYRYYNDLDNARRCFEIGRKYIDGYRLLDVDYAGEKITELGALWDEYVACLDALAEISFQNKNFREARSYFFRMFNTPTSPLSFGETNDASVSQIQQIDKQVVNLQDDISVYEQAISSPLEIQSFPLFQDDNHTVIWDVLLNSLKKASSATTNTPIHLLWNRLNLNLQRYILTAQSFDGFSQAFKQALIDDLNILVSDPQFFQQASYTVEKLSSKSQFFLSIAQSRALNYDEYSFINRDILDITCADALQSNFVLSDGMRINNRLDKSQEELLVQLYREESKQYNTPPERIEQIKRIMFRIQEGAHVPDLQELHSMLTSKQSYYLEIDSQSEQAYDRLRSQLEQTLKTIKELSEKDSIDTEALDKLAQQQELMQYKQQQALFQKKNAQKELKQINEHIHNLAKNLKIAQQELEDRLETIRQYQQTITQKQIAQSGTLIQQVGKHIELRKKYLSLLETLHSQQQGATLQLLDEKRAVLSKQIEELKIQASEAVGNRKEFLQRQLAKLENEQVQLVQNFDSLFEPLRLIVEQIAHEEEKVWKTEDDLRSIERQLVEIIGTDKKVGILKTLLKQREALLLDSVGNIIKDPEYNQKIASINEQITQVEARFAQLLQKQILARSVLDAFHPIGSGDYRPLTKESLQQLQNQLNSQRGLIKEYRTLLKYHALQGESYRYHRSILNNLNSISDNLTNYKELSNRQTDELTRYMHAIIEARDGLSEVNNKLYLLSTLQQETGIDNNSLIGGGFQLDMVEMFQMESAMGLHITEYRRTFEERANLLQELNQALETKNRLEKERFEALQKHDQMLLDYLLPEIDVASNVVNSLSQKMIRINTYLHTLAAEYNKKFEHINSYRLDLQPKLRELQDKIKQMYQSMQLDEVHIENLVKDIFSTSSIPQNTLSKLTINDLKDVETLIKQQREEVARLNRTYKLGLKENFYKAKAVWSIAETFREESKLLSYEQLIEANKLDRVILEDELRLVRPLFEEFNIDWAYSDKFLGEAGKELDNSAANYLLWVEFLEKSALQLFQNELPKYSLSEVESFANDYLSSAQVQDNLLFVAKSKLAAAKIYMQRSLRYTKAAQKSPLKNKRVQEELDFAAALFFQFIEFTTRAESRQQGQAISQELKGSQEFPIKTRYPLESIDEARIFLGIIAALKGNYTEAINQYRLLLQKNIEKEKIEGAELKDFPIGQNEAASAGNYQYNDHLLVEYVSLLASKPSLIEAVYRLGKAYQALAEEEYNQSLKYQANSVNDRGQDNPHLIKLKDYGFKAIAYYTQLINSQTYSDFCRAALFQRAISYKLIGDYGNARKDFIVALGNAPAIEPSLSWASSNIKGDTPGEINPGYIRIIFELGKLYLDNGDYYAAAEAFLEATKNNFDPTNVSLVEAKIAYTQAIMGTKDWLKANFFLTDLVREMQNANRKLKHLYPLDIILDLGLAKKELMNLESALKTFKQVFQYAPKPLIKNDGLLDLKNEVGLQALETEFRDDIRPLALACLYSAEILLTQRKYDAAKEFFHQAEILFRILPWQEDRFMRQVSLTEYQAYRQKYLLMSRWGQLKADVSEFLYSLSGEYQRDLQLDTANTMTERLNYLLSSVEKTLNNVDDQKKQAQQFLISLNMLYSKESTRLPELQQQQTIIEKRKELRAQSDPLLKQYDSLSRLRIWLINAKNQDIEMLITEMNQKFPLGSIEGQILNKFTLSFIDFLSLTDDDRQFFNIEKNNLENLLLVPRRIERLAAFDEKLLTWIDNEIRETGLDDRFIPVSPQSAILEEVNLYRAVILSVINNRENYQELRKIVDSNIEINYLYPSRLLRTDLFFEMLEIGAMTSEYSEDWVYVEKYNRELLKNAYRPFFVQKDQSDLYRAKLALSKALINLSKEQMVTAAQQTVKEERLKQEKVAAAQKNEAKAILTELMQVKGDDAVSVLTRIQVRDLLSQVNT
ncbi:MAG: hypothetical protein K0S74_466 [Chlamydiales bacterium]|jgi:hypothetical protein|nr:hypothetical protein [Chlamydiales bacterium]